MPKRSTETTANGTPINGATKLPTKAQRFERATKDERIRLAMPIARAIVMGGVYALQEQPPDTSVNAFAEQLLGYSDDYLPESNERVDRALLAYDASFSIGVAVGLLLRPEALQKGGGR